MKKRVEQLLYFSFAVVLGWTALTLLSSSVASNNVNPAFSSPVTSAHLIGYKLPDIDVVNARDSTVAKMNFSGDNLVAILSRSGCTPYQTRLITKMRELSVSVDIPLKVIYTIGGGVFLQPSEIENSYNASRRDALMIRKVSRSNIPFWLTFGGLPTELTELKYYPIFLSVKDGNIVDTLLPPRTQSLMTDIFLDSAAELFGERQAPEAEAID